MVLKEFFIVDMVVYMNLYYFFVRFYVFNYIVNLFIYIGFDVKFRKEIIFLVILFRRK